MWSSTLECNVLEMVMVIVVNLILVILLVTIMIINILRCTVSKTSKNKVLLYLTDTSLYIYVCVKHFGMANIKFK